MQTTPDRYSKGDCRHLVGEGPIALLEARLREAVGMRHAVCVANGTLGLMGAAMAMNLTDREVIVPALAHAASVAGLLHLGAQLRVADVDPDTLTLDVAAARRAVTAKTAAVLAVDLFGTPSHTVSVRALAEERGLLYLADTAQAFGATAGSTHASSAADAVVLSFTTGKALDLGEGGAVLTNRRDIYERIVWHTQHPYRQRRDLGLHLTNPFAINMRMHPATAQLAVRELHGMQTRTAVHRGIVARAICLIEALGLGLCLPIGEPSMRSSYFRLPVRLNSSIDAALAALGDEGIAASTDPEPPVPFYQHPVFKVRYSRQITTPHVCRVAEHARRDVVTLQIGIDDTPKVGVSRCPGECSVNTLHV